MQGHERRNVTILSIIHVNYIFRPMLFFTIIRLDTIIGENYTIHNVMQYKL